VPWDAKNPPRPAKNWSKPAQSLCIRVANAVLKQSGDDKQATFACIAAVKRKYPDQIKGSKKNEGMPDNRISAADHIAEVYTLEGVTFEKVGEGESERYVTKGLTFAVAGRFVHPWWGEMDLSEDVLRSFKRNFDKKVLGTDVAIDERHDRGRAMGWIKSLNYPKKANYNGKDYIALLGDVEWTPEGRKLLEDKTYKYFSPEFGTYVEPDGKTEHTNVLLGGALTNRPFLKMMPSVKFEDGKGTTKNVLTFADGDPTKNDKEWEYEPDEDPEPFTKNYKDIDIDKLIEEEDDVTFEEFLAKLKKDLGVEFSDENALIEALKTGNANSTQLETIRAEAKKAGITFDDKTSTADIVTGMLTAQQSTITTLSEQVKTISTTLSTDRRATAVSALINARKIKPADKEKWENLWDKDVAMFESLAATLPVDPSLPKIGVIGGPGSLPAPGEQVEFEDDEKAQTKGSEYLKSIGLTPKSEAMVGKK
jgi:phage I-like protein